MFDVRRLLERLRSEEGFRSQPYMDSVGVWTIGYGTTRLWGHPVTKDTLPISIDDAKIVMKAGVIDAIEDCQALYGDTLDGLAPVHQEVLICLAYQLGRAKLTQFKKMNAAVQRYDTEQWARELQDSNLYRKATNRVTRMMQAVREGRWPLATGVAR